MTGGGRRTTSDAVGDLDQVCTFTVDDLCFGVAVSAVQEVLRYQPMTVVPRAAGCVSGLINLRGQIVTAVDLRRRLGLPDREPGAVPMNVIVQSRGEVVSLLVDDIGEVADSAAWCLEPPPVNLPLAVRDVLHGVLPTPDRILLILDPNRAADVTDASNSTGGTQ